MTHWAQQARPQPIPTYNRFGYYMNEAEFTPIANYSIPRDPNRRWEKTARKILPPPLPPRPKLQLPPPRQRPLPPARPIRGQFLAH
ncbi:hypothetical protein PR048_001443 [Dryococelus australis]|uniref:Uncharacterized protein n=1 Tax=Dryococelus australis TaxID=614101 RepID=A0ABQ9IHI2_9NEOP|nr:hypothetical protein PR048_001443 [Dryococelus australis]